MSTTGYCLFDKAHIWCLEWQEYPKVRDIHRYRVWWRTISLLTAYIDSIHLKKKKKQHQQTLDNSNVVTVLSVFEPWLLKLALGNPWIARNHMQNTMSSLLGEISKYTLKFQNYQKIISDQGYIALLVSSNTKRFLIISDIHALSMNMGMTKNIYNELFNLSI